MLCVNLAVVDTIHPKRNKFTTGVKIKTTYESNLLSALKAIIKHFQGFQYL